MVFRTVKMEVLPAKLAILTEIAFAWSADNGRAGWEHFAKPEIGFLAIAGISEKPQLVSAKLTCVHSVDVFQNAAWWDALIKNKDIWALLCYQIALNHKLFPQW